MEAVKKFHESGARTVNELKNEVDCSILKSFRTLTEGFTGLSSVENKNKFREDLSGELTRTISPKTL